MRTKINRPISPEEVAVIRTTLERAPVAPEHSRLATSVESLRAVDQCSCGCDSVDFEAQGSVQPAKRTGDAIGTTPAGGVVGVIVWGRDDAITGLEVYDLGAGEDGLRLPTLDSIRGFREGAA